MELALCKHAYKPAIWHPYFYRICLKVISLNEIYVLVPDATFESIKFK